MSAAVARDLHLLLAFLRQHPRLVVLTGAGVSVASGIPAYRDADGRWRNLPPIQHRDFLTSAPARQRYWSRSLRGWPGVRDARPNPAHLALARLERGGHIELLVTQNVDRLHQRAGSARVVDLHGRLDRVRCQRCGAVLGRERVQRELERLNPGIATAGGARRPDGDVDLDDASVEDFRVPDCPACAGILMPDVVFFGGTVPRERVAAVEAALEGSDALLVAGSSLQVYSGFRFCRLARNLGRPIALLGPGHTRADELASVRCTTPSEAALPWLAERLEQSAAPAPPLENAP